MCVDQSHHELAEHFTLGNGRRRVGYRSDTTEPNVLWSERQHDRQTNQGEAVSSRLEGPKRLEVCRSNCDESFTVEPSEELPRKRDGTHANFVRAHVDVDLTFGCSLAEETDASLHVNELRADAVAFTTRALERNFEGHGASTIEGRKYQLV